MGSGELRDHLRARGLFVLHVSRHPTDPQAFIVFLHGNAGQTANGSARRIIRRVPGVVSVVESVQTSAILLVRVSSP